MGATERPDPPAAGRETPAPGRANASDRTPRGGWSGSWASIRDLEVLRAVIRHGGVTAAARRLGVSQPAVSRTLAQLEERSGRTFFTRHGVQLAPTAEALQLYAASTGVFESLDAIEAFRWLEPEQERLSIVAAPTLGHCLLPQIIAQFARTHPHVSVSIDIQTSVEVLSLIASDQAQVGVAEVPEGDWGVRKHPFRRSNLAVAMRRDHRWSASASISSNEIGDEPLIVLLKRNPFRTMLDRLLWREGGLPNVVLEVPDAMSALEYVEQGMGVAIVNPFPVMLRAQEEIHYALLEPTMVYETCMLTNPGTPLTPGAREFMNIIDVCQVPASNLSIPIRR